MQIIDKIKTFLNRNNEDKYGITVDTSRVYKRNIAPQGRIFFVAKCKYNGVAYELPELVWVAGMDEVKIKRELKDRLIVFIKESEGKHSKRKVA